MSRWSVQQVLDAAPDASSIAAARKLATPAPWTDTGSTETLLWGKCQGSGKTPYQVSIDLERPAYRCSCPSRKFPCKHGLALMLLWAQSDNDIASTDQAADFAAEWAAGAHAAKAAREARAAKPVDPVAQAKRLDKRLALMDAGIEDFALWLTDVVRTGMATVKSQPMSWWDSSAARLVDAQLPGLGDSVRRTASELQGHPAWSDHLLEAVGRWWLAVQSWRRRAELDPDTMADLRVVIGWTMSSDEVRGAGAIDDAWQVVGVHRDDDGRIQEQRTWLRAYSTGELVLSLDFAAGSATLPLARAVGSTLLGALHPYPGHAPRRVLVPDDLRQGEAVTALPVGGSLADAQHALATQLAGNPWNRRRPVIVEELHLTATAVIDSAGTSLRLPDDFDALGALAVTGGHAVRCLGEIDDGVFRPLTVELSPQLSSRSGLVVL